MSNNHERDVEELLNVFSGIQPEADSTERALEAARQRLMETSGLVPSASTSDVAPQQRRSRKYLMLIRSTVVAALVVAAGFLSWPILNESSEAIAFDDVQKELGNVRTVVYHVGTERDGRKVHSVKHMARSDGRSRSEHSTGEWMVSNPETLAVMYVDPKDKTVHTRYVLDWDKRRSQDFIDEIRGMHKKAGAVSIGAKEIDDVSCPGFEIKEKAGSLRVWVDPQTRLPVLAERTRKGKFPPLDAIKHLKPWEGFTYEQSSLVDGVVVHTWSGFQYDVALADDLFVVKQPKGYVATTEGTRPGKRRPQPRKPLVIKPGIGIGELTFGMSKDEVIKRLGEPEEIVHEKFDPKKYPNLPKNAVIRGEREWDVLKYNSWGLSLAVRPIAGLDDISCNGFSYKGSSVASFAGQTTEGIRIGSSIDDVKREYGEPDSGRVQNSSGFMYYRDKRLSFEIRDDKVLKIGCGRNEGAIRIGIAPAKTDT